MSTIAFAVAIILLLVVGLVAWFSTMEPARTAVITLGLLMVHELGLRWLANIAHADPALITGVSLWKEAALVGLGIGIVVRWRRSAASFEPLMADWALLLLFAIGLFSVGISANRIAGLAALRDYFEPMLLYVIARLLLPGRSQLSRWLAGWLILASLIAALAIWQGLVWDAADYVRFGFGEASGQVGIPEVGIAGATRIRPPSTVTGPNELSLHMMLATALSLTLLLSDLRRNALLWGAAALTFAALVLTASRSGFLGLVAAVAVIILLWAVRRLRGQRAQIDRRRMALLALVAVLMLAGGLWATGFGAFLFETASNLGSQYHFVDTADAIRYLAAHPAGVGMGLVGPRQGFGFPPVAAYHVEGSLFQIAMEMGVWGLGAFLLFLALALRSAWSGLAVLSPSPLRALTTVAIAGWVGAMVAFLFLPLMQALPLMAWLWFLLGLACSAPKIQAAWEASRRLSPQAAPTMPPPSSTG